MVLYQIQDGQYKVVAPHRSGRRPSWFIRCRPGTSATAPEAGDYAAAPAPPPLLSPDGVSGTGGESAGAVPRRRVRLMSNLQILFQAPIFSVQLLIDGILVGAIFALVAYGMALVWGVMNIINVAQGELVMLGGYVTLLLVRRRAARRSWAFRSRRWSCTWWAGACTTR